MFHRLSLWLVYLLIVLSPLPLGSNRPAFEGLIACLSGIALMAYAAGLLQKKQTFAIPLSALKYTLIAFGAVFLWGMVQSFKLPPLWGHSIWAEASAALGQPLPSYISVDPSLTRLTVLNILSYGTLFFLALQFGSSLKILIKHPKKESHCVFDV